MHPFYLFLHLGFVVFSVLAEMKTKTHQSLRWTHLVLVLVTLALAATLLRHFKGSSSDSTLPSASDQFLEPSPENVEENSFRQDSQSVAIEGSENTAANYNAPAASYSFEGEVSHADSSSVSQTEGGDIQEKDSQSIVPGGLENEVKTSDAPLMNSVSSSPPDQETKSLNSASTSQKEVCDYAKGRWVVGNRPPFYSGLECKKWLPRAWACESTQQVDFSYGGYQWQPLNCEMPEFERFTFLRRMQDKTIAFIGDSLGRQQFHSLMCMVTGGEESPDVKDVGQEYGFVKRPGASHPDGWAFRFPATKTTILFYWSSTLCKLEQIESTDPHFKTAIHLDRLPNFMIEFLPRFDVLILNSAHHWNKAKFINNGWLMHVNGKPIEDGFLLDMRNVKNFTIHKVVKWLDTQLSLHSHLKAFFRTRSPRHFLKRDSANCKNNSPLTVEDKAFQGEASDRIVENAVKGTKVKTLDITALSTLRDDTHKSPYLIFGTSPFYDCLHWCLPGVPDTWNELLSAQL